MLRSWYATAAALVLALASPVGAYDNSDFPIRVYVSPYLKGTEDTAEPVPIPEGAYRALRQGVLDWVDLMIRAISQPAKQEDTAYTIVLNRKIDEKRLESFNKLNFLVLQEKREGADLVIEASDRYNLRGNDERYGRATVGLFSGRRGYRIGRIDMSLKKSVGERLSPVDDLDLRIVLIHELGHALGLDHSPRNANNGGCNVMSDAKPDQYECAVDVPFECRPERENSRCIAIQDRQLREIEEQMFAPPGSRRASATSSPPDDEDDEATKLFNRGVEKSKQGDHLGAIAEYTRTIALDPKLSDAYFNRGLNYLRTDQTAAALADFDKYLTLEPDNPDGHRNRALAREKSGNLDGAIADLDRAIALKGDDSLTYFNRGVLHRRLGKNDRALADFSKAIALKSDLADAYRARAAVHLDSGTSPAAVLPDAERFVQLQPDEPSGYELRGFIQARLKNWSAARADWQKAVALWSARGDQVNAKRLQAQLKRLEGR